MQTLLQWKRSIAYSGCVYVATVIQNAMRMRQNILSSVAYWLCNILPRYVINGKIFGGKFVEHKICVLDFLYIFRLKHLILRRNGRDIIINTHKSSCKCPLLLSHFNQIWFFLTDFRKMLKYEISWKLYYFEASCYVLAERQTDKQEDGQTDIMNLVVTFRNFPNASKKENWCWFCKLNVLIL